MTYTIVTTRRDSQELAKQVNERLSIGWELYGSPLCTRGGVWAQAMTKTSEAERRLETLRAGDQR